MCSEPRLPDDDDSLDEDSVPDDDDWEGIPESSVPASGDEEPEHALNATPITTKIALRITSLHAGLCL